MAFELPKLKKPDRRVLIADDEILLAQRFAEYLKGKGFSTKVVHTGNEALAAAKNWLPEVVFYDLMLPELNAVAFIRQLKNENLLGDGKVKVLVTSGQSSGHNIQECLKAGASDYLTRKMSHEDLFARLILNLQSKREVLDVHTKPSNDENLAHYFMYLTDLSLREALKGAPSEKCLYNLTGMLGIALKAVRVSCIACDLESKKGWVIASNDKKNIARLEIDLGKYPEILYVMTHNKLLALDNLAADPTMHFVRKATKDIHFNSMIVAPLRISDSSWGVMSVRFPENKKKLNDFEIRYASLLSHVMGMVISSDESLKRLPDGKTSGKNQLDPNKPKKSA